MTLKKQLVVLASARFRLFPPPPPPCRRTVRAATHGKPGAVPAMIQHGLVIEPRRIPVGVAILHLENANANAM
jgi:hypothetical protein